MPAIVLYLATTIAIVILWRRYVQPVGTAAAIALVLLPLCFTGRALLTARVYSPIDLPYMSEPMRGHARDAGLDGVHNGTLSDLYAQIIPWQHAARSALIRGEWPVWNPYLLCGSILAANMQAAPYDPINLLGMLLPHAQALTYAASMAFFLAAFFTFAFARALGCGETASLVAAAGYTFNAVSAFYIGWPIARAWCFLPLVLFAVRAVVHETSIRATALLTLALTLTIFAGHPESVLHIVAAGVAYGIHELVPLRRRALRPMAHASVAGVLALLVTAISLMPFVAVAPETHEYEQRRNIYAPASLYWTGDHVASRAARTFLPYFGGQPERGNATALWEPSGARTGSIVVALSLAALLCAKSKERWFFFALAIIGFFCAFDAPPIAQLVHKLPLFDITLNQRLGVAAAFAVSILAAFALGEYRTSRRNAVTTGGALVLAGLAIAIVTGAIWSSQVAAGVDPALNQALTLAELIPLAIAALLLALRTPARVALPLILGLVLVQRTLVDGAIYPTLDPKAFYVRTPIIEAIQKDIRTPFRITGQYFAFIPDTAALYGLEDARGYEAMTYERLMQTFPFWSMPQPVSFNVVTDLSKPFLSFLNIRYAITAVTQPPPEGWRVVMDDRDARLVENTRVLPRAFVPRRVRYEKSGPDTLIAMSRNADFADVAWITVPHYAAHEIANGPGTLALVREGASYTIDATMEQDGWVVLSDSKWPGWRAYIDGSRVETHYANHAFIGVFVPKGKHTVRLVYEPEAFTRGRTVTLLTLAGIALFFALRHRLEKPRAV